MRSAKISGVHFPLMTRFCRDRDVDGGAAVVQGIIGHPCSSLLLSSRTLQEDENVLRAPCPAW